MPWRISLTLIALSLLNISSKAGCTYLFHFALLNEQSVVVEYVQPTNPLMIELLPGQSLQASLGFTSCCGGQSVLHRDGIFVDEWIGDFGGGSAQWETSEPGNYSWWVEGYCNMALPVTVEIVIQSAPVTSVAEVLNDQAFNIGPVMFEGNITYFECLSDQNSRLQVEVFTSDGRRLQTFMERILTGQNRIPVNMPTHAHGMFLFRFTTSEGKVTVRRAILGP